MSTAAESKEAELDAKLKEYKSLMDQATALYQKADLVYDEISKEIGHDELLTRLRALMAASKLH